MYFAPTAPHSPLQVPEKYFSRCPGITTPPTSQVVNGSLLICAMMACVDDAVHNITKALKARGMYDNTLFVYSSDNGGVASLGSNNYPFKGLLKNLNPYFNSALQT